MTNHINRMSGKHGMRWATLSAMLLIAVAPVHAQRDQIPRHLLPPGLVMEPQLTPQERATIDRALSDLNAENPELRAGAVMLLGKYHATQAKEAVVKALDDPSARVRRAALVSIAEWRNGLSANSVDPVLQRLADDDVEVRRAVTAMIPQMMSIWRTARMIRPEYANRELSSETRSALTNAYRDEDVVVRRNMLVNHHNVGVHLDPEVFIELLQDPERSVRLEAIPYAIGYGDPARWAPLAEEIAASDDAVARLRLTNQLARRGTPESLELLQTLAGDPDPEISAEAFLALFRFTSESHYIDTLLNRLRAGQLSQEQSLQLISMLRGYRDLARPVAVELTQLQSAVLRQEAARMFFGHELGTVHPEVVDQLLVDSNQDIRALTVNELFADPALFTTQRQSAMLDNPHADVRAALVKAAIRNPRDDRDASADLLFDLMLDESVLVRATALEAIGITRIDGWTEIVAASMEDPDSTMQRTAASILLQNPQFPDRKEILQDFVEANPDSPLTPRIRAEVGRGKIIEIDMNNL